MAYRTGTRRRVRSTAQRGQQGGGAGRVLLGLLAAAALMYFIMASAAGSWLSENVINPVLEAFNPAPEQSVAADDGYIVPSGAGGGVDFIDAPVETFTSVSTGIGAVDGTSAGVVEAAAKPTAAPLTGTDLTLEGAILYTIQMGAFKSEANAGTEADAISAKGGAGYVFFDGELYRVLASAYATEADAKAVKSQLKDEGVEAGVFALEVGEVKLHVTAGENVVKAMTNAMNAVKDARNELTALCVSYDKNEKTKEQAKSSLDAVNENLQAALTELSRQAGSDNAVISRLAALLEKMAASVEKLSSDSSQTLDFSSRMKYTQIGMVSDTIDFVTAITN